MTCAREWLCSFGDTSALCKKAIQKNLIDYIYCFEALCNESSTTKPASNAQKYFRFENAKYVHRSSLREHPNRKENKSVRG